MAIIKVQRDKGWVDGWRKYKIFINGKNTAVIKEGEEIALDLAPGNYEIWGKIDFGKTGKIKLDIQDNKEIHHLLIYSNLRGSKLLLAAIYGILSIFLSEQWIKIKEIQDVTL